MARKEWLWIIVILTAVISLFFYQTVFLGKVPFPGDILVSDFQPWRSSSYLGYGAGGIPNKAQYPDTIRQMYPWKTLAVESLKQGKLPLWNPYNFSGTPLLANFQTAAMYPLGVLYLFMSQMNAWTVLIVLQPLLAALFTYWYARKLGMRPEGSALAALSYGFSGFMAVWLEYSTVGQVILWLPLILLAIENRWLWLITVGNAAALFAGHPQVYSYMFVFTSIYALFRSKHKKLVLIFSLLGVGIAGIQLIPGIELIANAARSPHDPNNLFTKILIQPWQLFALPFPNIFGNPATRTYWPADTFVGKVTTIGLIPLFFSFSAIRRKDDATKWFITATIATLFLITSNPLTQILYRIPIPLITSSSPTLMSFLFAFSLAITCGLGLDYWMTDKHSVKKLVRRTLEVCAGFGILFLATKLPITPFLSEHAPIARRALIYGGMLSAATLGLFWVAIRLPKFRTHAIILLLIIHTLDLFVFFNRFNPFVPKALVFPAHPIITYLAKKAPDRYWGYGTANIAANFATQYGMYSPEGYDPLYPKWYGEFLYSYRNGSPLKQFDNATRSDAAITSNFGDGGLSGLNKQKILNALSVRYILDRTENGSSEQTYPPAIFKKVYAFEDWTVYENINASPRAYMDNGTATILSYKPEHVIIRTESTRSASLILTDTYYPGWQAHIDGNPATIIRTNWTMRGVVVPAGKHTVTMTYKPKSATYGAILSMISIAGTIIGLVMVTRKRV